MPKASRQSSLEAFSKGDYEKAYDEFSELLTTFPKDPLYKYYSGVCLVKLNRDAETAVSFLKEARKGAAVVRTIPSDATFWLGRAQQLSGDFPGAIDSYEQFTEQVGRKTAKDFDVTSLIQECQENKGRTPEPKVIAPATIKKVDPGVEEKKVVPENETRIIPGAETLTSDFDKILTEALEYQHKADSITKIAEEQKGKLENLGYKEKTDLRAEITEMESKAASFQVIADTKYAEAQAKMNSIPFTGEHIGNQSNSLPVDSTKIQIRDVKAAIPKTEIPVSTDAAKVPAERLEQKAKIEKPEAQVRKDSVNQPLIKKQVPQNIIIPEKVYSLFKVNPKPVFKPDEKVVIDPQVPEGLVYRIQVAVFRNPIAPSYFKGLSPVLGFKVSGADKTNYYVGMFRRMADAKKALITVKQKGFNDAFIVSFFGGKSVSAERALQFEKEWGGKPLINGINARVEITKDTIPPTLSFRVEVTRSTKPLKEDIIDGIKKMAGHRGLDSETLSDGTIIYLIGSFITYVSAEEYADLLTRNGYREAKVVAWLGKKEIPVDTAKQLFEGIE